MAASTRNLLLNFTIALLIPAFGYYLALILNPNFNIYLSPEYIEINKISKKITKLKDKKNNLEELEISLLKSEEFQDRSKINNLKNEILEVKKDIKNLKNLRKEKEDDFGKKYGDSANTSKKALFYISQFIGILAILSGIFIKISAVKSGLIMGGVFSIILGNLSYWQDLSDITKLVQILVLLALVIFVTYKLYQEEDTKKNKQSKSRG